MRDIVVVACTRGEILGTDVYRSVTRLGIEDRCFFENNRVGLATCYNRFLAEHAGRDCLAVFVHDDVSIEDVFLRDKLVAGAERFAIQGLAGSASFDLQLESQQTMWIRAPREDLSGAVEHVMSDGRTCWRAYGPVPQPCVVLDGLFLAVDLARVGSLRFDEQFDFHFYDLDFCISAHLRSLDLGTVNVHVRHRSSGSFASTEFRETQDRFRDKWRGRI